MKVEWATFKSFVSTRGLSIQWIQSGDVYVMRAADGFFELACAMFTDELLAYFLDEVMGMNISGFYFDSIGPKGIKKFVDKYPELFRRVI